MTICGLYFSGTGNTLFVATHLKQSLQEHGITLNLHSIEQFREYSEGTSACYRIDTQIAHEIAVADQILFAYPIHGSVPPRIMREFVDATKEHFSGKLCAVVITQMMFSGDGGAYLARILRKSGANISIIEHINMPNNLSDQWLFPIKNGVSNRHNLIEAKRKIEKVAIAFSERKYHRTGDTVVGRVLGLFQSIPFLKMEPALIKSLTIDKARCTRCATCVSLCPTRNLFVDTTGTISHFTNCTLCYRCINICPRQAISLLHAAKPEIQYHGVVDL